MKNLLVPILLSLVFVSCKKEKQPDTPTVIDAPSTPENTISVGEYIILEVSDSVRYATEYHVYNPSELKLIPMYSTDKMVFLNNQVYFHRAIYTEGINLTQGVFCDSLDRPLGFIDYSANQGNFIESIPGNELERGEAYLLELDPSKVVSYYTPDLTVLENSWNKIKDLRIVHEYRTNYPDSKIAFLHMETPAGVSRDYFFMNKYKP